MKSALIASLIVMVGIVLLMGVLLSSGSRLQSTDKVDTIPPGAARAKTDLSSDFVYLDSCGKHLFKDFQGKDIFVKNKEIISKTSIPGLIKSGKKLEEILKRLLSNNQLQNFTLVLEGNLNNEWAPQFDRNNTWAYKLSYDRALTVYKLWLKNGINLRKYPVETVISGGGYYGLCPQQDKNSRRFSVQLIPKNPD